MDRELVLAVLTPVCLGSALLSCGWWPPLRETNSPSARTWEQRAWVRVWAPILPAILAMAVLLGWAIAEPERAEPVGAPLLAVALFFAGFLVRAAGRAVRALRPVNEPLAATRGVLRPRIVISQRLVSVLDAREVQAVREHEHAHARHRDVLRIWVGQVVTDLQWPWPHAQARFCDWLRALEAARDEEARRHGVDGCDLAGAILAAARLAGCARPAASLLGSGRAVEERIARLLAPVSVAEPQSRTRFLGIAVLIMGIAGAVVFGVRFGEPVVRALVGRTL